MITEVYLFLPITFCLNILKSIFPLMNTFTRSYHHIITINGIQDMNPSLRNTRNTLVKWSLSLREPQISKYNHVWGGHAVAKWA